MEFYGEAKEEGDHLMAPQVCLVSMMTLRMMTKMKIHTTTTATKKKTAKTKKTDKGDNDIEEVEEVQMVI